MQVTYDANVCIHAGNCVKSLPAVFKVVDGQFVIDQQGASEAAIRQTVAACPSGALQITKTSPRCERVRTGAGPGRRGSLCRPAWQEGRAPGQRETIWRARGNDPRPCAESPAPLRPASGVNGR